MRLSRATFLAVAVVFLAAVGVPAQADHTDPARPLSPVDGPPGRATATGIGSWVVQRSFPANPGTDLALFRRGAESYLAAGTLGGGPTGHVGQRLISLGDAGGLNPQWVADHGSAACGGDPATVGNTRLQHDSAVAPAIDPVLLFDTTDDTGRCHDPSSGGLEIIDISGVGVPGGAPVRELALTRHNGMSHTVTVDDARPWIVYSSNGEYNQQSWIDVLDVRSCMGSAGRSLADKRAACQPPVFRIPLEAAWTTQLTGGRSAGQRSCHEVTVVDGLLYCAALNSTVILDVTDLTDSSGAIRGTPLPCRLQPGTNTTATVTDCTIGGPSPESAVAAYNNIGRPAAQGWRYLGAIPHAGTNGNLTNSSVASDQGIAISHQAEPTPAAIGKYLLVSDERGGGIRAPGASCQPGSANPIGNGGIHAFEVSNPAAPVPVSAAGGGNAVFIATPTVATATFCTAHVFFHVPDEQRIIAAWYRQGVVVADYTIDANGQWTFTQTAALLLPQAQAWAADLIRTRNNSDGTRTYELAIGDMRRGLDIVTWTAPPNPIGAQAAAQSPVTTAPVPGDPPPAPSSESPVAPPQPAPQLDAVTPDGDLAPTPPIAGSAPVATAPATSASPTGTSPAAPRRSGLIAADILLVLGIGAPSIWLWLRRRNP